jgi:hypothetical protein
MADYQPTIPPDAPNEEIRALSDWALRELDNVARAMNETTILRLQELNVAPERPRDGMVVYADGTNWNPGSGEGVYARINGTWTKLFP